jgi:hypothetical protein
MSRVYIGTRAAASVKTYNASLLPDKRRNRKIAPKFPVIRLYVHLNAGLPQKLRLDSQPTTPYDIIRET